MAIPKHRLPEWVQDWLDVIVPGSQILGILLVAYLLQRLLRRLNPPRLHDILKAL